MTSLAAARLFHLSHGVGTRFFSAPLLLRAKKGYFSSGPVRFIPGSCARIKKTQSSVKKDSISIQHLAQMLGNNASGVKNLDDGLLQEVSFEHETYLLVYNHTKHGLNNHGKS
ncbi:hypothetical protein HPP92_020503 [Vanilla planifolia]|uniref:Uncharacterized protein n=1 Tax=Vanilla planifolia TaxID=51239 RepID=A0A835Q2G5_VANPL|nr:hypothetical protein HPP92_020503 [Vanilla planifolia]